jgi:hypothetical protein
MFVLNGCITSTTPAPLPKTTLKGKVVVPEGAVKGKRVTGEALAEATVNIVNPKTDNVIATTTTDVNGNYNVDVTAGGPYIVEAGKGNVKVLDVSPIIQEGETKDLGTADATSTAQALIFMYLVEAGSDPSQIDIDAIPNLSGFSQLVNQIETILEAGGDPTTNTQVNNVINNIVSPQPATGGGGGGTPTPTPLPEKSTYQIIFEDLKNEYPIRDLVVVSGDQDAINGAVEQKILDLVLVPIVVTLKTNVKGKSGYDAVRIQPVNAGNHIQLWAKDTNDNWHDINAVGWGDLGGFELPVEYKAATEVYFLSDKSGEYELTVQLVDINNDNKEIAKASKKVYVVATNEEELENAIYKAEGGVVLLGSNFASKKELTLKNSVTLKSRVKHGAVFNKTVNIDTIGVVIEDVRFVAGDGHSIIIDKIDNIKIEGCEFDAKNRFMTEPHINAIQLVNKCSNITIDNCSFRNGYYVTINGYADNLTVQNCTIENCKSGINLQGGENLRVINTDISVIAKGVDNDTYCVRFASSSDSSGNNLTVSGGKYKVDKNGLVADETKAFHSAIIIRSGASGDLKASGLHIIGEVVNLSNTELDAKGNKWGIAGQTMPEEGQLKGNTKKIIVE